jgi:chorismate dehydratase
LGLLTSNRLRIAAINFLNPAPLMWDFEHGPRNQSLAQRYNVHYTLPSVCAEQLLTGRADLGLIPIASLTSDLAIVPGCAIASLDRVRSIQLIVKLKGEAATDGVLAQVQTVSADTASRSSLAYAQLLFRRFIGTDPEFLSVPADPVAMLARADAALLIGDPALLALENRAGIEKTTGPCLWLDLAYEWTSRTHLPWIAAVWAIRRKSFGSIDPNQLIDDLQLSRDHGLSHVDALVEEWTPRIAIPPSTIRNYLTQNIHYQLSADCITAIETFRSYAAEADILAPLSALQFLERSSH